MFIEIPVSGPSLDLTNFVITNTTDLLLIIIIAILCIFIGCIFGFVLIRRF